MSVDEQVEEPDETAMHNNNSTKESDFDSFNFEQAIAEILLELRENFMTSTAATCFVSEKIKIYFRQTDTYETFNKILQKRY